MSVTFKPKKCPTVKGQYGPEPEYWANFANVNATRMLDVAGLPNDCCGDYPLAKLPEVAQRLIRALNKREVFSQPESLVQRPDNKSCKVIDCGTTEDRERERIHCLLRIVSACIALQTDLSWD
jgi:hypothetical protein